MTEEAPIDVSKLTFPTDSFVDSYMQFAVNSEAPDRIHFWCAIAAIAGALGRRTWIDLGNFDFTPNVYIIIVAPPGVVAKSTTINTAISLLKEVEGTYFGPDMVTPQALLDCFTDAMDFFELDGKIHRHSSLIVEASEFGNLFRNREDVLSNLLIALWDGKRGIFQKRTKKDGKQTLENPLLTMIGATTPSWVSHNITEQMISGGFISRCLFPFADQKQRLIAYPQGRTGNTALVRGAFRASLVRQLKEIRSLHGPFHLSPEAMDFGEAWYAQHFSSLPMSYDPARFSGYRERKQGHMHKVAMCLAASDHSFPVIHKRHLELALTMLDDLEKDFEHVFSSVGKSTTSMHVDKLISYVHMRGHVLLAEAHGAVHHLFPSSNTFADILAGCIEAGYLEKQGTGRDVWLIAGKKKPRSLVENELSITKSLMDLNLPVMGMDLGRME